LLLLGDPDQLASVEVGSVMAELARMAISDSPDEPLAGEHDDGARAMGTTTEFTLLRGCIRRLRGNHRSARGSSLPGLLDCVRRADSRGLAQTLQAGAGVEWLGDPGARNAALERALGWFAPMLGRDDPGAVLAGFSDARVLVALREGSNGARGWNEDIMRALGLLQTRGAGRADDALVRGTPLLITRNDPVSGLSNGDVVIAWGPRRGSRAEYVLSAGAQGGLQTLALDALPPHEPAFALTAHKAQGSEYRRVLVALPPDPHPLITREWLYTAFSRAREQLVVSATAATLDAGLAASSRRVSGLADALLMDR
jgi:exodeoxyribonuclease V alpha subunit